MSALRRSVQAWRFNTWVSLNVSWILYGILSVAILLQQFPETEPLVLGFWWINIITFFAGGMVAQASGISNVRSVYAQIAINLFGIAVQVFLITCHWETLVAIDDALRIFRGNLATNVLHFGDHLIFGRVVWLLATIAMIVSSLKAGRLVYSVPRNRPW